MSFFDFIADTWEDECRPSQDNRDNPKLPNRGGAQPHPRDSYLDGHPQSATCQRVCRAARHNMLPKIVGPYLPQSDHPSTYQFHCVSMLVLLKPWRNIQDLLPAGQTWASAFASFMSSATSRQRNIISGAQYYYQCRDAADQSADDQPAIVTSSGGPLDTSIDETADEPGIPTTGVLSEPSEAEMVVLLESMQNQCKLRHGQAAVAIARGTKPFQFSLECSWSVKKPSAHTATEGDIQNITHWCKAMVDATTRKSRPAPGRAAQSQASHGQVVPISAAPLSAFGPSYGSVVIEPVVGEAIRPVETSCLKEDQLRGFNIIAKHLTASLAGQSPKQLLMQIQGEGGTGKSMVIHCVMQLFRINAVEHKIVTSAYTRVAASHIDGNTLHTLCRLTSNKEIGQRILEELRRTWKDIEYLIIDEISMVSWELLAQISSVLCAVKQQSGQPANVCPFGGINVIILGDFHQFPPVACGPTGPLYYPPNLDRDKEESRGENIHHRKKRNRSKGDSPEAIMGAKIYRKF
ncbi:hypothetical protein FRC06_010097, partial [Ceratobasidium sp. 370]